MFASHLSILLAEDDPTDVFFITRALRKAGFENQIHVVQTPQLVLDYLQRNEPYSDPSKFSDPGLIIVDGNILGKPHEALIWIREQPRFKNLPVVVFSGSQNPEHEKLALQLGANAYHVKAQNPEEFAQTIKVIAERWLHSK